MASMGHKDAHFDVYFIQRIELLCSGGVENIKLWCTRRVAHGGDMLSKEREGGEWGRTYGEFFAFELHLCLVVF